jgi:hypothetical protein
MAAPSAKLSPRRGRPLARRQCRNPAHSVDDLRSSGGQCRLGAHSSGLVDLTRCLMEKLVQSDPGECADAAHFYGRVRHGRQDLHEAMAQAVDGAMIWGGKRPFCRFGHCHFPIGRKWQFSGPGYPSLRWTQGHGATPTNRSLGAGALRAMSGSLTSRHVPHPRFCFSKKAGQSTAQFLSLCGAPLNRKPGAPAANDSRRLDLGDLPGARVLAAADTAHQAVFPQGPDWTLLFGSGSDLPQPFKAEP